MIRFQIDGFHRSHTMAMPLRISDERYLTGNSCSTSGQKRLTNVLALSLLIAFLAGCEKARLDEQVRELCAKDGGIKVYEQVKLSADKFEKFGDINFYHPSQKEALGPEYVFERQQTFYKRGNPEMWRFHYRVLRRKDQKLLGESVLYARRGGDMPGPWHESSFSCPKDAGDVFLLRQIFAKVS